MTIQITQPESLVLLHEVAPVSEPTHGNGTWGKDLTPRAPDESAIHVFDTAAWLQAWERATAERHLWHRYLQHDRTDGLPSVTPFYLIADSPMWNSYEADADVPPVWLSPVVVTPSLYSFYGSNAAPAERAQSIVDCGLDQARRAGAAAFVVGNLEPDVAIGWAATINPAPTVSMVLDRTYRADVSHGVERHLSGLDGHARREFSRQWRRSAQRGVSLTALRGADMLPRVAEMHALADATSRRHGPPLYTTETFEAVSQIPGATMLLAERSGEAVGAFLTFLHGDSLYLWAGGCDYARRAELGTYSFLLYESIRFAVHSGCRYIEAGRGNFQFKERHGFVPTDLWSLVYLMPGPGHSELRSRLEHMDRRLRAHLSLAPLPQ